MAYEDTLKNEKRRRCVLMAKIPDLVPAPILVNIMSVDTGWDRLYFFTLQVNEMVSFCGLGVLYSAF